ncbi:MAG: VIT1/CCC1 transporter family protein [Candidatus Harrisonbacteria bacterium]|nr:VIT1/CCC1 transporter family protein [Candidatus Harrisonbacteria bacterium]
MQATQKEKAQTYIRNFVFGVEDSLVSTVGLLSGIAFAGVAKETIILTGVILIFVEALSMGVGSFLSQSSADELRSALPSRYARSGGLVMFFSYFASGFIPLAPYLFASGFKPLIYSIGLSLAALFLLGFFSAKLGSGKAMHSALRMLLLGGLAVVVGAAVGALIG